MVFFVLTAALSGTFSNLLIPLQIGARDMASGFMNMLSYWLFFLSSLIMISSLLNLVLQFRVDDLPSFKCFTTAMVVLVWV
jgi:heme/copper-type cytochrome/quinol oxidase subunit 1